MRDALNDSGKGICLWEGDPEPTGKFQELGGDAEKACRSSHLSPQSLSFFSFLSSPSAPLVCVRRSKETGSLVEKRHLTGRILELESQDLGSNPTSDT